MVPKPTRYNLTISNESLGMLPDPQHAYEFTMSVHHKNYPPSCKNLYEALHHVISVNEKILHNKK